MPSPNDVCLIRDEKFLEHQCPDYPHPEGPRRVVELLSELEHHSLFKTLPQLALRTLSEARLRSVHSEALVSQLKNTLGKTGWIDPDTYYTPESFEIAKLAAGTVVDLALSIWRREYRRGFALVRPPGHHATSSRSMGFCLINHVALAVQSILNEAPQTRVAIVDFDLHHGNGTQEIFNENPNVLFLSSHRYPFFPGTGTLEEIGQKRGRGTKINFPLSQPFSEEFILPLYSQIVLPILRDFKPEMIFVSAGYDGHLLDPMQGLRLTTPAYGALTEMLLHAAESLSEGRILFCLEGGYHPKALGESVFESLFKLVQYPRSEVPLEVTKRTKEQWLMEKYIQHLSPLFPQLF